MGLDDKLLGELTKKFGIQGDQAKAALEKMLPFVQGKLPGVGGGVGLMSQWKKPETAAEHVEHDDPLHHVSADEKDTHVEEVAKHSGLDMDTIRKMLPEIAGFLKR
jgi:hypothetical protein